MQQVVIRFLICSLVTAATLSGLGLTGVGTAAATPADPHRPTGIIDGSINDLTAADNSNILGALLNSNLSDGSNNANTRTPGAKNNSVLQ